MLQKIRDLTHGWFTWVLISFICFTFALWGIHNYMGGTGASNIVASVNNVDITEAELQSAFQNLVNQQRMLLGNQFDPGESYEKHLREQALEQIIVLQTLIQTAKSEGFSISQEQVQQALTLSPVFQDNGVFSPQKFALASRLMQVSPTEFLNQIRQQLLIDQVQNGIMQTAFVLPDEITRLEKLWSQTRDIRYLVIPFTQFVKKQPVTDDQAKEYYEAHMEDFKLPVSVKIDYIQISRNEIAKDPQFKGNDQKIEQQFADLSEKLANEAYENPDSLKPAAEKLGLKINTTDYFSRNNPLALVKDPNTLKVIFSEDLLNQSYNSDIINLDSGDRIVLRIANKKPAQTLAFNEAKKDIQNILKQQLAQTSIKEAAEEAYKQMEQGKSLNQLAKNFNVSVQERKSITRQLEKSDPLNPLIVEKAFSLRPGTGIDSLGGAILPNGDYVLISLTNIHYNNKSSTEMQKEAFKNKLQNSYGKLDYDYYVRTALEHANIKRTS